MLDFLLIRPDVQDKKKRRNDWLARIHMLYCMGHITFYLSKGIVLSYYQLSLMRGVVTTVCSEVDKGIVIMSESGSHQ